MMTKKPRLAVVRQNSSQTSRRSSHKLLKTALWFVWLPIIAVSWVMLLDTSYDWISSPSTARVLAGLLILILMACIVIWFGVKGARRLWTR
jgi:hypothetical protein